MVVGSEEEVSELNAGMRCREAVTAWLTAQMRKMKRAA